ncbi:hypothetical protein [Pseudomonas lactis]|jgi:hypothetical protein|uniref:Uncharacterized protein n=1 Tax=Pseudomonas lactis TaxID=1615674 RepID=I4KEI6_9PSED|nr:hypothetical protein [Pseudomonas lactis]EIK63126.1 hypothetical protein PflSS101_4032 [Pseudomonas lactis]TKJ95307.1 hypothetical protein PflCFBP13510_28655 [Pseudomonas fluorescens]
MRELYRVQDLQLKLIELAMINESCAADLVAILNRVDSADAESVRGIISSLQNQKENLRQIARDIVSTF